MFQIFKNPYININKDLTNNSQDICSQDIELQEFSNNKNTNTKGNNKMKFSHSLQFNSVPEWSSKYINYSSLKKVAYNLQREHVQELNSKRDNEQPEFTLDPNDPTNPTNIFIQSLDREAEKIDKFYQLQEETLLKEYTLMFKEFIEFELEFPFDKGDEKVRQTLRQLLNELTPNYETLVLEHAHQHNIYDLQANNVGNEEEGDEIYNDADENNVDIVDDSIDNIIASPILSPPFPSENRADQAIDDIDSLTLRKNKSIPTLFYDDDFHVTFLEALKAEKKSLVSRVFTHLSELKAYIELNKIGFGKAAKKFDKLLQVNIKKDYLKHLETDYYVFRTLTFADLNEKVSKVIKLYSIFTNNNIPEAKLELSTNLREKVVFERNTVWRDMIGMERKSQAAYAKLDSSASKPAKPWKIKLGAGRVLEIPMFLTNLNFLTILFILTITIILLNKSPFSDVQQKNCFAVLICCSLLWATESIPLFTTSLLLPFLIVILSVLKDPTSNELLSASDASKFICSAMWSPIILLLLGGFTIAAALSKHNLDKLACTFLLSKVRQKPQPILFSIMVVSTLISAFVSNVAAPVLMYSVVQPILNTLNDSTVNGKTIKNQFAQALVLGIALSSSIAGMASPIASPQNVVALQFMNPQPNWIQWFIVSIPVCSCCLIIIFIILLFSFSFNDVTIIPITQNHDKLNARQYFVLFISITTIILWCLSSILEPWLGDMGQIALLSIVAFYSTGCLSQDDFNNYPWTIVILAMGGMALGKAVTVSGLLSTIATLIKEKLENSELFTILAVFSFIVLIMATFVSHTVAALIIIPLIEEIGKTLPDPHPNILVFSTALICSCAMGLPTSGFPNVTAIGLTNSVGEKYLNVSTFIKIGIPTSFACGFVVITVGYLCLKIIGM